MQPDARGLDVAQALAGGSGGGDSFETLHKDGKALGLPVTLVVDRHGCELGVVEGRRQMGFGRGAGAGRDAEGRVGA